MSCKAKSGGPPQGHGLDGVIGFLRIARGTLADAKTTIEEIHAWEFDGPFLRDFTGRRRPADGGEAGAIDDAVSDKVNAGTNGAGPDAPDSARTAPAVRG